MRGCMPVGPVGFGEASVRSETCRNDAEAKSLSP